MSVDNVYLSVVNDRHAHQYLSAVVAGRKANGTPPYRLQGSVLKTLCCRAGVQDDWLKLSEYERQQAWELIIDHVYGDEIAGLNPCSEIVLSTHNKREVDCFGTNINLEEKEENMSVTVETKHYVSGTDVNTMSANDLINCVKAIEKEIGELKDINIQSSYVLKKVEELEATLNVVVGHLDSK